MHSLCICNSDDLAGDCIRSLCAVATAKCLSQQAAGTWYMACVLCLVVSVAGGLVSDSRLWAVEPASCLDGSGRFVFLFF